MDNLDKIYEGILNEGKEKILFKHKGWIIKIESDGGYSVSGPGKGTFFTEKIEELFNV
jgi:hypothetical protein